MQFGVLGAVEARPAPAGAPLELGSPLQRVLLGLLLTEPGRPVSLDRIVDQLWGDAPPADPDASVQTYVSRLRRALGAQVVERTPSGYRLAVAPGDVDAGQFAELAAAAHDLLAAGDPARAVEAADRALALWRGPVALEDAGDREFAVAVRTRLDALRDACQEDRITALLQLGRAAEAVADAEGLVAVHPLRERPWVLLIEALHAAGRAADALARYTQVRRLLDEELGVEPGEALRAAQARVLRNEAPDVPAPPARPDPAAPARPGLVGRAEEVAVLRDLLAALPRSGPRFVLLDGEAGIGKTRLATEAAAAAAAAGARVAWGRCHEDDDAPALWPWQQIVSALTGTAERLGGTDDGAFAAFERVLQTLVSASARGPVVVVVDDLHWADPASLRLLSFLAVELQHGPVAVLATCRAEVRDPALGRVRATLARTSGFLQLRLGPLGPAETGRLVEGIVGDGNGLDDGALADLHERSGGNPFFATELARMLGVDDDSPAVPPGVRDVVDRRLAGLPENARAVLRLAATVGQRFDVSLLQRAGDPGDDDALADALDAASEADLIRPAGRGRLAFAHALVRETLLAETPELRRSRLHARVAAALAEHADPFARAHHLVSGRPFTDARATVAACAAAAERAAADHAHESAARWWERALAALDADPAGEPPALRQELLLRAGTTMARAGSFASAQQLLGAVIDSALERDDVDTAALAADQLWGIGGLWFPVTYNTYPEHLIARLEALLAAIGDVDGPARVRTLATLATLCHYGPDRGRGVRDAARALAIARRTGRPDLIATALTAQLAALWLPGHERELIATATELLTLTGQDERPELAVQALSRRGVARLALGDVDGDAEDLAAAWELAGRHELPLIHAQLVSMQAARAMLAGSFDLAMELIDRASALNQRTQLYTQSWQEVVMRAFVWIDQGCLPERMASVSPDAAGPDGGGGDTLLTTLTLLQAGRPVEAAAVMAERDAFARMPMQWDWLSLTCWQAQIASDLAVFPEVRLEEGLLDRLADDLLPFAEQLAIQGGIGALGPVGVYLGRVEAAAGRRESAEAHLRESIEVAERHGFRPPLAKARLALAELLAARGARAEAAAEAVQARAVAQEIGMRLVADGAARLAHE